MKEKLCPECKVLDHCLFKECADLVAKRVPVLEDNETQQEAALRASQIIARKRIEARGKGCPNVNDVDPDYPGKKLL